MKNAPRTPKTAPDAPTDTAPSSATFVGSASNAYDVALAKSPVLR
jgi:hypothetical protein